MPVEPNNATVSATAANTPVQLLLQALDREARLTLTGTYTGLEGALYASAAPTTSTPAYNDASWLPINAQQESNGNAANGTLNPGSANLSYFIKGIGNYNWLQFNPTQISTGTAVMTLTSGNSFGGGVVPAVPAAVNAGAPGGTLIATALGSTENSTPTAAQMLGGLITQTSVTGSGTATLPTGTLMSGGYSTTPAVGTYFTWIFANIGTQTVTLTAASGHTIVGTAAVPTLKDATVTTVCSGVNTWVSYVTLSD